MARVIDHYYGQTGGRCYAYYTRAFSTSNRVQLEPGVTLWISADTDGSLFVSEGYLKVLVAGGWKWLPQYDATNVQAVYTTVADACTAPTSVTLNTTTKTLTAKGGAGGDLNTFAGYQYAYKDRVTGGSWGDWSAAAKLGTNATSSKVVSAPAGHERKYRVRTIGSGGAELYSSWVGCDTVLVGNTAPGAPSITKPASNAVAPSTTPTILLTCPAEPDGGTQTLKRRIDSGSWTTVTTIAAAGASVKDTLPTLSAGSHTVRYKLVDAYAAEGSAVSVTFTVSVPAWSRTIATGTVIANATISHRADINELLAAVNAARLFYGLSAIALSGTVGAFAAWQGQMQALQTGMTAVYTKTGRTVPAWTTVPVYPTAAIVNQLRTAIATA